MITLVWRTDLHLADKSPSSRKDNWTLTCLNKIVQVGEIAREVEADAVLDGGDFFHVKAPSRNSHRIVRRVADIHKAYPCPVYANVGNHDCSSGDIRNLPKQPLGVLFSTGVFERLYDEHELLLERDGVSVRVVGVPYHGTSYDMERFAVEKGDEDWLVVIAHVLASEQGGTMFEGEDIVKYSDLEGLDADVFCFLPGSQVLTSEGCPQEIETLKTGDFLWGRNRKGNEILEVHPERFVKENVISLSVEGVPSEMIPGVTVDHPFLVAKDMHCFLPSRRKRRCHPDKIKNSHPCSGCEQEPEVKPQWIPASQIKKGDFVSIPVPQIPEEAHSEPSLARFLGYYLAEGHIIKNRKGHPKAGVGFTFHKEEYFLQEHVACLSQTLFGRDSFHHPQPNSAAVQTMVYGSEVASFCLENGGQYATEKQLSSWVWSLDRESRFQLLVGWLLGDGHARNPKRYDRRKVAVMGATSSSALATQMYLLSLSLGLRPYYTKRPEEFEVEISGHLVDYIHPSHIISFYGDCAETLSLHLGVKFPLRTKTKVSGFFHGGLYWTRVRDVNSFYYEGPVYNIRTSTEEYVTGLLLNHNCFGHWHKDQGITEIKSGKWVVNVGSLTRGSLSQDHLKRAPACVVLRLGGDIELERRDLDVGDPEEVFDLEKRVRQEAKAQSMGEYTSRLKQLVTFNKKDTQSLDDQVRELPGIPEVVREKSLSYIEKAR